VSDESLNKGLAMLLMQKSNLAWLALVCRSALAWLCTVMLACSDEAPAKPSFERSDSSISGADGGPLPGVDADARDAALADTTPPPDASPSAPEGSVSAPRPVPTVVAVNPEVVRRGEPLVLLGHGLQGALTVTIGGVHANVEAAQDDRLIVTVPESLPLSGCHTQAEVAISNGHAQSEPKLVAVRSDGPRVPPSTSTNVAAGTAIQLEGHELADARATLGAAAIPTSNATTTSIVLEVPRSAPTGLARVVLAGACGSSEVTLYVLERAPRIEGVEPVTLAAQGVAWIHADVARRDQVTAVQVGEVLLPVEADSWAPPASGAKDVLAVRMPAGLSLGEQPIMLKGAAADSDAFTITGVAASYQHPPSSPKLAFTPEVADGGTFPIITTGPFFRMADANYDHETRDWYYQLDFEPTCAAQGRVYGTERFGQSFEDGNFGECDPTHVICHPLDGTYRLGKDSNSIDLTIDRTSTGGTRERYTGGWTTKDGSPLTNRANGVWIALRSRANGQQILIDHWFDHQQCPGGSSE
jgi:hypothetical protein